MHSNRSTKYFFPFSIEITNLALPCDVIDFKFMLYFINLVSYFENSFD